ncbi:MAG: hypothetical protein G01um101433_230 [Parcubacteria group bacterium Gr01-1014_33]|nr:MAG: hypothetical protein G01um101433_230 [Parcubacteria group bacterium Gr01-1014_33]
MAEAAIKEILKAVPIFFRMKFPHAWFDYDKEADVLYISFKRPQQATDSELSEDDVILRRRGKEIVGLTILRASRFRT